MKCMQQQMAVSHLQNERSGVIEQLRFTSPGKTRGDLESQLASVETRLAKAEDELAQCMENEDSGAV